MAKWSVMHLKSFLSLKTEIADFVLDFVLLFEPDK